KDIDSKSIEMEGASFNLISNEMGVPSLILISISDTADGDAPENFDEFAKIAAKISAKFIMQILSNI
ncbi:5'-methylthioadenosine/adenosylhomocysteine nucleosidase, partial [Francisella tularensis subsp. holarctica]|nr:5'-methylthioadenosine/adenosylhomocysteine nucleosidase [Francisella tularensis subsp. holarctica]